MQQSESGKRYDRRMEDLECHHRQLFETVEQRFYEMILTAQAWKQKETLDLARWKSYKARGLWFELQKEYIEEKFGSPKLIKVAHGMVLFA